MPEAAKLATATVVARQDSITAQGLRSKEEDSHLGAHIGLELRLARPSNQRAQCLKRPNRRQYPRDGPYQAF